MIMETSGDATVDFEVDPGDSESTEVKVTEAPRLASGGAGLIADNLVALDYRGHANSGGPIVRPPIDAHHFPHHTDEYFRAARDLRGQRQRDVQFAAGIQFFFQREIDAARRDIPRLSVASR